MSSYQVTYPKRKTTDVESNIILDVMEEVHEEFKKSEINLAQRRVYELESVRHDLARLKNASPRWQELEHLRIRARLDKTRMAPDLYKELEALEAPESAVEEALACAKSCLSVAETRSDVTADQTLFFVGKREGVKATLRHLSAIVADQATANMNLIQVMGQVIDDGKIDQLVTTLALQECRSLNGGYLDEPDEGVYDFDISTKEGVEITEGGVQIFGGRVLYVPGTRSFTLSADFPDLDARYDPKADALTVTIGKGIPGPGVPDEVESRLTFHYCIVNKGLVSVTIADFVKNETRYPLLDRLEKNLKDAKDALDKVAAAKLPEQGGEAL